MHQLEPTNNIRNENQHDSVLEHLACMENCNAASFKIRLDDIFDVSFTVQNSGYF